ncbi:MAG TPA: hypothetical protein VGN83_16635 [Falsiroseomonas sp.]|jgi:hypothetical protein|nr:hypothetical protein [Falsiroseomonas sp.]
MRHIRHLLLPVVLLAPFAGPASAELPKPSCEAIAQWVEGYERREGWSPNALNRRDRFSALFAEPATAALFGRPVLDWTPDEARALAPHLAECGNTLRRGGNREAGGALSRLRIHAQREVPTYLAALAEARAEVPRLLAVLGEEPASLPLLRFHLALAEAAENPETAAQANEAIRGLGGEGRNHARALMAALRDVPEPEFATLLGPAAARLPALRTGLAEALLAEAGTAPPTLAGLQALERQERGLAEHAPALGEAEATRVAAGFAARRAAIGTALRADLVQQVASVPADPMAVQRLNQIRQRATQQYAAAIGAEGMRAVDAALATRRGEIGAALVEQTLATVARLPATPAALRALHALETEPDPPTIVLIGPAGLRRVQAAAAARRLALGAEVGTAMRSQLAAVPAAPEGFAALDRVVPAEVLALLPPAAAAQVTEAVATRRGEIAEAVLPGLRAELAGLPETDESLALIDGVVLRGIAGWPDSAAAERARFSGLVKERRAVILAAVNRAEAGPLRGRIYEGPKVKLEFLDATRVVVTEPGAPPEAGTYTEEPDGRVIVTTSARSVVMTREGRRLAAGPLEVRRVK